MRTHTSALCILMLAGCGALPAAAPDNAENSDQAASDRPVTAQEIDQLKQEISDSSHSSVEGIFGYHSETGDANNELDFYRFGGKLNYLWQPGTVLYVRGAGTSYRTQNSLVNARGINVTGGVNASLSDAVQAQFEAGGTSFSGGGTTVNALGSLRYKASGGSNLYVSGSRANVEESLLSAAGITPRLGPFANKLVGQVMDNRVVGGGLLKLTSRLDVSGEGGAGQRTGQNIQSNSFRVASGGAGFNLVSGPDESALSLLRASYNLDYFGFDHDLLGYGGVSLVSARGLMLAPDQVGGDGMSIAGTGGYFSPQSFVSNVARIELHGRPEEHFEYGFSAFIGAQNYTGSPTRQAAGFFASITLRLSDQFSLPITYARDNFGPFTQQSFFVRLVARL